MAFDRRHEEQNVGAAASLVDASNLVSTSATNDAHQEAVRRWENASAGRYYEARMVRDLFGDCFVLRVWGGIGNAHGAMRFDPLASPGAYAEELARIDKRRIQRGYFLRP